MKAEEWMAELMEAALQQGLGTFAATYFVTVGMSEFWEELSDEAWVYVDDEPKNDGM